METPQEKNLCETFTKKSDKLRGPLAPLGGPLFLIIPILSWLIDPHEASDKAYVFADTKKLLIVSVHQFTADQSVIQNDCMYMQLFLCTLYCLSLKLAIIH